MKKTKLRHRLYNLRLPLRLWATAKRAPDRWEREHAGYQLLAIVARHVHPNYVLTEYGKSWFEDDAFFAAYERLGGQGNFRSADRKFNLRSILQLVSGLPGDTAECGVYEGASSWFICDQTRGRNKVHHAFDSFEGLSVPGAVDAGYWKAGDLASPEAQARANLAGLEVSFHKGWIPDCFDEVQDSRFCFVHIDVDLYKPTLDSVSFFYPRMVPGGILLFDDYGFLTCPGATRAVDEFMAGKPEPVIELSSGQALVIKRTESIDGCG